MDHLSRTLPTENIFNLLRSPCQESLIPYYDSAFTFDMLKVIIKWLEVSFRKCNRLLELLRLTIQFALGTWF